MLQIEAKDKKILVSSVWESGTHLGFHASFVDYTRPHGASLDKLLTKEQIEVIEWSISAQIAAMVKADIDD